LLIIDDNMQIINLLRDLLSERYKVLFAVDGETGLKIIADRHPDIVISDVMMPGISGIEVCRRVKSDPVTSHIPVVLLTAKAGEESRLEGLKTGADAYLSKPFSSGILIATIENILLTRQKLKERFSAMEEIVPSEVAKNKVDEHFLNRVIAFIEDNIADPEMDVIKLCSMMGMSRSALYRKIKFLTNLSIQEFIRKNRLRKARQYLVNTDKSISEVSYLVGFPNAKNFSTSFRKEFNQSPSEFRK
jgi:DNA-binding response OmpR family regulator